MSQPGYGPPGDTGERWSVNMPAVIGVVFVFLVGVIVWVITSSGDDDAATTAEAPTTPVTQATVVGANSDSTVASTAVTETTTEAPMPDLTTVSSSSTTTTSTTAAPTTSTTAPPPSTAPGAPDGTVLGDLAIPGQPMQQPGCDGAFITVLASAVGEQATAEGIADVLATYPGSNYLRTDQTCASLNPDVDGAPIYIVYLGPFAVDSDACAARSEGPEDAYARRLSDDLGPDHSVACA